MRVCVCVCVCVCLCVWIACKIPKNHNAGFIILKKTGII